MISVCIASYNGAASLHAQLASILSQLSLDDEIIISDDGSSDNTLEIIAAFHSPIIRCVEGPRTGSLIDNFEHALTLAKGDYIFLADQDDVWMPNKVESMMRTLQQGYDCVISDCHVTDGELNVTHPSFFEQIHMHPGKWYNLLVHNHYLGCCMLFNRKVLHAALPFPKNIPMHDIWIGNIAAFAFKTTFLHEPLIYFRRHGHNSSTTASKSPFSLQEKLFFRTRIIFPLLQRLARCRRSSK